MTVTIYYKSVKIEDTYECDQWGIDSNNSILRIYKDMPHSKKPGMTIQRCIAFIRLTEIRKVEITNEKRQL